ncbi:putative membrane protein [Carnobacterium iners]|uniref:Putative membrane protein n=1 Tax=Carnobacterium iners TaxID=1073423 RepID=A0A1X7MS37_9LACT|nr:phage holin family protein [Carnobacterium iners]SEK86720.1 putative membrane protein [Carnobacterium iners]SMH26856.1 putative membrane protein [Carnobacterium iners]
MKYWQLIVINALTFLALSGFFQNSFYVANIWIALAASLVLSVLNIAVKPLLILLSLPITILTLGLFSIIINASMLSLTSLIIGSGFQFGTFGTTIVVAIILSLVNTFITNRVRMNSW